MDSTAILQEILAADRKGREACEAARGEKENFLRDREQLCRRAEELAARRAEEDVKKAESEARERAQAALTSLEDKQKYRLRELRTRCEAGKETWAETLFRTVVGLDD